MSKFETKEEYLTYLSRWKDTTNAEETKSKRVICDHVQYNWSGCFTQEEQACFKEKRYTGIAGHEYSVPNGGHYKDHGWLDATHYVFNNVMRGKDPKRGFSPKMKRKLQYGETPWIKFERAAWQLEYVIKDAEAYVEHLGLGKGKGHKSRCGKAVKAFLVPFGGMVTIADLLKIDTEELANARRFHRQFIHG